VIAVNYSESIPFNETVVCAQFIVFNCRVIVTSLCLLKFLSHINMTVSFLFIFTNQTCYCEQLNLSFILLLLKVNTKPKAEMYDLIKQENSTFNITLLN